MAEKLDEEVPSVPAFTRPWEVVDFHGNKKVPFFKVTFEANTGEQRVWRLVPNEDGSNITTIRQGLSFINGGKFMTVQGKTLERWLFEQWQADGGPPGAVSGSPD